MCITKHQCRWVRRKTTFYSFTATFAVRDLERLKYENFRKKNYFHLAVSKHTLNVLCIEINCRKLYSFLNPFLYISIFIYKYIRGVYYSSGAKTFI